MVKDYYLDYIKHQTTGYGVLESELGDKELNDILNDALQEVARYYDQSVIKTVAGGNVIDISDWNVATVANVFRANSPSNSTDTIYSTYATDPTYLGFWQNGNTYNLTNYTENYITYSLLQKIRNTVSEDLVFRREGNNLYINYNGEAPTYITVEYIPQLQDASQVDGNYWIDILKRIALAYTKIQLGQIRTRFTQSGALWQDNGQAILAEGNQELSQLRERLQTNADFIYPLD